MKRKKTISFQWIMGKHAIREVLFHSPNRLIEIYIGISKQSFQHDPLFSLIQEKRISIRFVSKSQLRSLVNTDSHQGIVARVQNRKIWDLREFLNHNQSKKEMLLVMLDCIFDPQNMGAIIRCCECFGVDGVIWSKNRGGEITPLVAKSSCGATELLPMIQVSNLAETARKLENLEFSIIIADMQGKTPFHRFCFPNRSLFIVGSEGKGVQQILKNMAQYSIAIPMQGNIDSLNVAQATAVILSRRVTQEE